MGVLDVPPPSLGWSFARGVATGLLVAAGGMGALLALTPTRIVLHRSESAAPNQIEAPDPESDFDQRLDKVAALYGAHLDERMHRASRIYFAAFRSMRGSNDMAVTYYVLAIKDYVRDQQVPFNDLLADQLRNSIEIGSIGPPGPMPESFQEASRLLHQMDFE